MRILVVENNSPDLIAKNRANGYLPTAEAYGRTLAALDADVAFSTVAPYAGEEVVLDGIDGTVFTGAGVIWNTSDKRAAPLQRAMEQIFAAGLPTFGSCNGMQLAATVLGGEVAEGPNGYEAILARNLRLTEAGRDHPMFAGRKDGFAVPCGHRDDVIRMPDGAVLLATNDHTRVQAFVIETGGVDFWGTQYHPEEKLSDTVRYHLGKDNPDENLIRLLRTAETDADAAAELGTTPEEMAQDVRATELRNWLAHVAAKRS